MSRLSAKNLLSKNRVVSWLVTVLFIYGMFSPTSLNANIMNTITLYITPYVILALLFIIILFVNRANVKITVAVLLINAIIWAATLFNPQTNIMQTIATKYVLVSLLFLVNLRGIEPKKSILRSFNLVNWIVIAIGFAMVAHNQSINDVFVYYYSDYYPELVASMLNSGKPVITFATHSVAGFYLFVFFYLNYKSYSVYKRKTYLISCLIYLFFLFSVSSNTAFVFLAIGLGMLIRKSKHRHIWMASAVVLVCAFLYFNQTETLALYLFLKLQITNTFQSSGNGLLGRYSTSGNQLPNINYIKEHPFSPTGLSTSYNDDLIYYDSGWIVTTLEGTFVLALLLYGTLVMFFRNQFLDRKTATLFCWTYLLFEIGFNNLFYFRTIGILPFIILYLNYLERTKEVIP